MKVRDSSHFFLVALPANSSALLCLHITTSNFSAVAASTNVSSAASSVAELKGMRTELKPMNLISLATVPGAGGAFAELGPPEAEASCGSAVNQFTPTSLIRAPFESPTYRPSVRKGNLIVSKRSTCGRAVGIRTHVCEAGAPLPFCSVNCPAPMPPPRVVHVSRARVPLLEVKHFPCVLSCKVVGSHCQLLVVCEQGQSEKLPPAARRHSEAADAEEDDEEEEVMLPARTPLPRPAALPPSATASGQQPHRHGGAATGEVHAASRRPGPRRAGSRGRSGSRGPPPMAGRVS
mmetsp:Transcript_60646/g.198424  ORF Transcript_60646/g.198424 Transcript_60646/m.198424 type:complete len:292 (+) Transcript_60646:1257-2132(+)